MRKRKEIILDYQYDPDLVDDENVYEVYRQLFEDIAASLKGQDVVSPLPISSHQKYEKP